MFNSNCFNESHDLLLVSLKISKNNFSFKEICNLFLLTATSNHFKAKKKRRLTEIKTGTNAVFLRVLIFFISILLYKRRKIFNKIIFCDIFKFFLINKNIFEIIFSQICFLPDLKIKLIKFLYKFNLFKLFTDKELNLRLNF